jgi:hypothetical protein
MSSLKYQSSNRGMFTGVNVALTRPFNVERVTRIELARPAWKVVLTVRPGACSLRSLPSGHRKRPAFAVPNDPLMGQA